LKNSFFNLTTIRALALSNQKWKLLFISTLIPSVADILQYCHKLLQEVKEFLCSSLSFYIFFQGFLKDWHPACYFAEISIASNYIIPSR